jgi:glutamate transport system substrate-binding protein
MNRISTLTAVVACTALGAVTLAGCGGGSTAVPAGPGKASSAASLARLVDQSSAVAAGPVGKNLPSTPTLDRIRKRGSLLYAGARTGLGFSQLDPATQKVSGFDAGMAQLLAKYLLGKPEAKLQSGGSDTREALLGNHTVDAAIETYSITPERAKLVNFAGPYYMAHSAIVVKSDNTSITKATDLAGKKVATESGAGKDALLAAAPTAKPVLFDTASEMIAALQQGRVEAATLNSALLLGATAGKPAVKTLPATYGSNPFGIGIAKDDPAFKTIVNQFLKTIETDGTWTKLYDDTAGKLIKGKAPTPPATGSVEGS